MKKVKLVPLLTRKQMAKYLGVTPRSLYGYIEKGMPVMYVGKNPRFDLKEVQAFFKKGEVFKRKEAPRLTPEESHAAIEKLNPELAARLKAVRAATLNKDYLKQEEERANRLQKISEEFIRDTYAKSKLGE